MRERGNTRDTVRGSRISYGFVVSKGTQTRDKAEDIDFIIQNNVPLDLHYYITNHFMPTLSKILVVLDGEVPNFNITQLFAEPISHALRSKFRCSTLPIVTKDAFDDFF